MAGFPQKETQEKGERQVLTKIFREFKGVNTKADRTSIPQECFYDLVNLMPIGQANLHSIPDISSFLVDYAADSIYWMQYANINSTDYMIMFATNGKVFAYNIGSNTSAQINAGHLFSGANSRMDQWKNQVIVFVDSTGYYYWDGTTFTGPVAGTGGTNILPTPTYTAPDIAVFANRIWIYIGRALYIGSLNSYDNTSFQLTNGALIQLLTDPQIRGEITRMISANGYLYLLAKSSITAISDVYIPNGASPPAPQFSIVPVQSTIGCDQPASVFTLNRDLCFANTYGLWALRGVTADRLSEDIDGSIQYLDTSLAISGGVAKVNNIINACFLFKQTGNPNLPTAGVRIGMFFDKKWWFAQYAPDGNSLSFVAWGIKTNVPSLFVLAGNKLYQAFQNLSSSPAATWKTALWGMEDSIADKEVFRVGFEITSYFSGGNFTFSLDTPTASTPLSIANNAGAISWQNNSGAIVSWTNNALSTVLWFNSSYLLYVGDGLGGFGKYVGFTGSSSAGTVFDISSNLMDYTLRKRW